ncbi:hypothetical protein E2F47_22155 [Mycobacterium eburneum]|nr:hypothetical protein [Mycobacterium eburneum]TDH48871.1 hypothetical protein E2F47_22155 [Mycobacterium eburneum]
MSTANLALWLAEHVDTIAADEHADVCYLEIEGIVHDIVRAINRPLPPRFCGPCPAQLDADHDRNCTQQHPHACATAITAPRDADNTSCPSCGAIHDPDELERELLKVIESWWMTQNELLLAMESIRQPVPLRTFQEWRKKRKIPSILGVDGAPRYRLLDAQRLRQQKTQIATTGTRAHRKRARA